MSKWINKELFQDFTKQKKSEADAPQTGGVRRSDLVWKTPEKGTVDKPKVYEGRFIPDGSGKFYEKYSYHMFLCGDKWAFSICPKTYNFENYCPFCSATSKLYQGTAADKKMAGNYKRKDKFVSNFFINSDPRDVDVEPEDKVGKTVKLYEFPGKVEMKLKEEITDTKNGYGYKIFDPGEDGHDFILKVLSTKKDVNGKIWPDYSSSTFARASEAIGTDDEIEKIMKSTTNLDEYIKGLEVPKDIIIKWLKAEMLYEIVEDEIIRANGAKEVADKAKDDIDDSMWDEDAKQQEEQSKDSEPEPDGDGDLNDQELLDELEKM